MSRDGSDSERLPESDVTCLNCGARLDGAYCGRCGQLAESPVRPLPTFVRESLAELFSWDGTRLRTLRLLVTRPGALTAEYLAGKRVSYVHPMRLFVEVGVATYLVTRLIPTDFDLFGVAPELFGEDVPLTALLGTVGFIAVGVGTHWFALRAERPMAIEHVVFVLHVLTFSFLLAPIEGLLYLASSGNTWLGVGSFLFAPAVISLYWLIALRRFLGRESLRETYLSAFTVYGLFVAALVVIQTLGAVSGF